MFQSRRLPHSGAWATPTGGPVLRQKSLSDVREDCRNHKIEMIVTKSVSRFGRNTEETLDVLNKLRALLIDVYFEAEGIHTRKAGQDFLISLLEGYAQEESRARSQNIKWGISEGLRSRRSKLYNRESVSVIAKIRKAI